MSKKLILLIGAPGSGKKTDAKHITEKYAESISSYSTGDLIREEIKRDTAIGKIATNFVAKGDLVPTNIVIEIIITAINNAPTEIVLLDGFPGKHKQLQYFCDFIFHNDSIKLISVIEVKVSEKVARERCMAIGKPEDIFEHEMTAYNQAINEIEADFKDKKVLHIIDGEQELDAVITEMDTFLMSKIS